jgi:hypothetical protein
MEEISLRDVGVDGRDQLDIDVYGRNQFERHRRGWKRPV